MTAEKHTNCPTCRCTDKIDFEDNIMHHSDTSYSKEQHEASELTKEQQIKLDFIDFANNKGFDTSFDFFNDKDVNNFTDDDTRLAFDIWLTATNLANKLTDKKTEDALSA
ncbi:MAG: hypothetical protein QM500_17800 [Methylococcales bacterium]